MTRIHPIVGRAALLALIAALVLQTSTQATSVIALNDQALVGLSHRIVEGTVTGVTSAWTPGREQIHTTVTINVRRTIKGDVQPGDDITLTLLGGQVGDDVMEVVSGPTFTVGQDVIIFLDATAPKLMPITGLYQGKFTVEIDAQSGERVIRERGVPVSQFISKITALVAEQERGEQ